MTIAVAILLLLCALFKCSNAQEDVACVSLQSQDVRSLFTQWNSALQSCDANKLAAMYWDHSVYQSEFWPLSLSTGQQRVDFFQALMVKNPRTQLVEDYVDIAGCNHAQYSGIYQMYLTDQQSGEIRTVTSRFTIVFVTYDKKYWAIKTMHASIMPGISPTITPPAIPLTTSSAKPPDYTSSPDAAPAPGDGDASMPSDAAPAPGDGDASAPSDAAPAPGTDDASAPADAAPVTAPVADATDDATVKDALAMMDRKKKKYNLRVVPKPSIVPPLVATMTPVVQKQTIAQDHLVPLVF